MLSYKMRTTKIHRHAASNKGGFDIHEELDIDNKSRFVGCTIVIGSNLYRYQDGVLIDITSRSENLELCDISAADAKHEQVMYNYRNGKYPCTVTTFFENCHQSIHPDHINCSSLLLAAKLRREHPDKTIYFQGKEYPKLN